MGELKSRVGLVCGGFGSIGDASWEDLEESFGTCEDTNIDTSRARALRG